MRQIAVQTFLSLDGVMQAPGGPDEDTDGGFTDGGWTVNYWDDMMNEVMGKALETEYDLLLGRRTYDIFAGFWPQADDPVITPKFNRATKYLLTHRPESATRETTVPLGPDPVAHLREIKTGDGSDLSASGSGELARLLLANDLVDRLSLWVFPIVLGKGKRLFGEERLEAGWALKGSAASSTGVVILDYERAERRPAGSFTDGG